MPLRCGGIYRVRCAGLRRCGEQRETVALISDVFLDEGTAERCVRQWNRMELDVIHLWDVIDDLLAL